MAQEAFKGTIAKSWPASRIETQGKADAAAFLKTEMDWAKRKQEVRERQKHNRMTPAKLRRMYDDFKVAHPTTLLTPEESAALQHAKDTVTNSSTTCSGQGDARYWEYTKCTCEGLKEPRRFSTRSAHYLCPKAKKESQAAIDDVAKLHDVLYYSFLLSLFRDTPENEIMPALQTVPGEQKSMSGYETKEGFTILWTDPNGKGAATRRGRGRTSSNGDE